MSQSICTSCFIMKLTQQVSLVHSFGSIFLKRWMQCVAWHGQGDLPHGLLLQPLASVSLRNFGVQSQL